MRSRSLPSRMPALGLQAVEAYKASVDMPPRFSMRKKIDDPADKQKRPGCQTYDIGKSSRTGIMTTPAWSMAPRANGIPKPPQVPGPGHYPQPGCIYGEHPTIAQPGRVAKTNVKRTEPSEWEPKETPSPQHYNTQQVNTFGRADQPTSPKFSIRTKLVDPSSKEKRPGCQTYDIKNLNRDGPMTSPKWSMAPRANGIAPPNGFPAPGEYLQPGTIYGAHPCLSQAGRVPQLTQRRSGPADWDPKETPGPDAYKVESVHGEFGSYALAKEPKYSIAKKISDPADKQKRPGCQTYDIGTCARTGPMNSPKWTMAARASGIPKPGNAPGPGEYPQPGCIYGAHPTISQPGRVPKTTVKRTEPSEWEPKCTPSPQEYSVVSQAGEFGRIDQAKAPKFSIRQKIVDPSIKEKRPGCQTYDLKNLDRHGPMMAPSWSMAARSAGLPPPTQGAGPGEYVIPGCIYGEHPSITQPGRVARSTEPRWKENVESLPY